MLLARVDSKFPEHRQHQRDLGCETDREGERAQYRNAERVNDRVRAGAFMRRHALLNFAAKASWYGYKQRRQAKRTRASA
jgi:hypothetical protein